MSDIKRKDEIKLAAYCRYCTSSISETTNMQCQCFEEGARFADKTMIDKACEWLKKNLQNYIEDDWTSEKDFIEEFRKSMEEQYSLGSASRSTTISKFRTMIWHDSGEEPKNGTDIIIVHDYFAHGFEQVEIANYSKGRFSTDRGFRHEWSDWAWKIKRWCYIEDILKLD